MAIEDTHYINQRPDVLAYNLQLDIANAVSTGEAGISHSTQAALERIDTFRKSLPTEERPLYAPLLDSMSRRVSLTENRK